jgi:hypothetical protein
MSNRPDTAPAPPEETPRAIRTLDDRDRRRRATRLVRLSEDAGLYEHSVLLSALKRRRPITGSW